MIFFRTNGQDIGNQAGLSNSINENVDRKDDLFPSWVSTFSFQAMFVVLFACLLYANTFGHEYALDDAVVISHNEYVQKGISGIKYILTRDSYESYFSQLKTKNQVQGGRYRPLSIVTFAIEQQLMGAVHHVHVVQANAEETLRLANLRHILNVCWYALSLIALLYFLRYIVFKDQPMLAFLATLIFAAHPLHTEVVANVKSRDEILSLFFICLTFITAFKYWENSRQWLMAASLLCFFLAYLSKEYAVTLIILLPLSLYIIKGATPKQGMRAVVPFIAVTLIYIGIRLLLMPERSELADTDIQINPYAYASGHEHVATVIATSLKYFKLLLLPDPLSSDYSYNQIPYCDFSNLWVWVAIAFYIALGAIMVYLINRKHVLGFATAFFTFNFLLVNNFIFNIGATLGERLIFHASVGFCIALAYLLFTACARLPTLRLQKTVLTTSALTILALYSYKTVGRNPDWKNDQTLFLKDIKVSPNSFLTNTNVASILINGSDDEQDSLVRIEHLHRGINMLHKAVAMQSNYVLGYLNLSVGFLKLRQPDSVVFNLEIIRGIFPYYPQLPQLYYYAGMDYFAAKAYEKSAAVLRMSVNLDPSLADARKQLVLVDSMLKVK